VTPSELLRFMRTHRLAVQASRAPDGSAQAALVGIGVKRSYFAAWPDGPTRASWPGLTYFRVRPTWIRYSDFNANPPLIIEFSSDHLPAAPSGS